MWAALACWQVVHQTLRTSCLPALHPSDGFPFSPAVCHYCQSKPATLLPLLVRIPAGRLLARPWQPLTLDPATLTFCDSFLRCRFRQSTPSSPFLIWGLGRCRSACVPAGRLHTRFCSSSMRTAVATSSVAWPFPYLQHTRQCQGGYALSPQSGTQVRLFMMVMVLSLRTAACSCPPHAGQSLLKEQFRTPGACCCKWAQLPNPPTTLMSPTLLTPSCLLLLLLLCGTCLCLLRTGRQDQRQRQAQLHPPATSPPLPPRFLPLLGYQSVSSLGKHP